MKGKSYDNVDDYIDAFDGLMHERLKTMRKVINEAAPEAEETFSYGMPTFKFFGILVHFAGWQHHVGFYPAPSSIIAFQNKLDQYETSRGTIKFPNDKPLPLTLIKEIVEFRIKENIEKVKKKGKKISWIEYVTGKKGIVKSCICNGSRILILS